MTSTSRKLDTFKCFFKTSFAVILKSFKFISVWFTTTLLSMVLHTAAQGKSEDLYFSTLTMADGLPSNIIAAIAQDDYDFIWIGTGSGLARYDGTSIKIFRKGETNNTLPSNELTALAVNGDHLWVGSWDGLCKINVKTFEITRIDLGSTKTIRTLHLGQNGILWVGTASGLIRYDTQSAAFELLNASKNGLSHNMVRTIYQQADGTIWTGTFNGLNKLPKDSNQFEIFLLASEITAPNQNHLILDIQPKSENEIWVGSELGLYEINTQASAATKINPIKGQFSNEVIKCIYTSDDKNLWLGTDFGVNRLDPVSKTNAPLFHNPSILHSISNNVVWQIFEDSGEVIWFVTSNGLSRVNKFGNFYTFHDINYTHDGQNIGNQLKSILADSKGFYWLATQHGVIKLNPKTGQKTIFSSSSPKGTRLLFDNVYALEEDNLGRIWIGSAAGINIWDDAMQTMQSITANPQNGLTSNYIGKFTKQADGTMWVSAWQGGLFKTEVDIHQVANIRFTPVKTLEGGSEKHVFGNGAIWAIEYDKLFKIDPNTLEAIEIEAFSQTAASRTIYTTYFSNGGHLWAGTIDGLIQYIPYTDQAIFHSFSAGDGTMVTGIIEDLSGTIWCTTNNSLFKLSPNSGFVEAFPLDNNLPIKSFYYGCAAINQNGKILFGGDNGFISFSPQGVTPNHYQPPIYITGMEVNNQTVPIGDANDDHLTLPSDIAFVKNLELAYAQRSVTFEFSSLHFWKPEMNSYSYMLEGFDKKWNQTTGKKNFAVYSNLAAGEYTFRVRGSNNHGISSPSEANLSLVVHPPTFLRPVFIVLYVLVILSMIVYALRTYSARVKLKNQLKITRLEKIHAEEIEQTKEAFFTNVSHELRTPISLILPPIHEIQKEGTLDTKSSTLISLAEKNAVRLLRLVNQILDFNKLESETLQLKLTQTEIVGFCKDIFTLFTDKAQRAHIDFTFEQQVDNQPIWIDADRIETVLFNLLSNAFKFTKDHGKISVRLSVIGSSAASKDGFFELVITDTGIGIPKSDQARIFERFYQSAAGQQKESGSGIGLTLAAEYVDLHHGLIEVESEINQGTSFRVLLPLGKRHLPIDPTIVDEQVHLLATPSVHGRKKGAKFYQLDLQSDKPLVLLIEDNPDMVEFVRNSLGHKYNFVSAEDGEEGLQKANNFSPQIIISDIMMPKMDGLTLCQKIKENPSTSHISIVLVTAKSLPSQRIEGINIGADAYITKPFEIELLEAHIDQLLDRKKTLTEYFRKDLIRMPEETDQSNNEDNKFVKRVMDIIEANISNSELTVEMISAEMAMSSTHLYRKLKATTDHSAKEIIQKYRLKKASLMLQNKEGNITEIMYQVGFSSLSYFSKCFKAEFDISPKQYQDRFNQKVTS